MYKIIIFYLKHVINYTINLLKIYTLTHAKCLYVLDKSSIEQPV